MAPLRDPTTLDQFKKVLSEWRYRDYIVWKDTAEGWVRKHLASWTTRAIGELMYQHVEAGGEIDHVAEKRPE